MAYPQHPAQRAPPVRNYGPGAPPTRGGAFQGPPPNGHYDYGYDNQHYGYSEGPQGSGRGYPGDSAVPRSYGPPPGAPRPPRGGYGPPMESRGYAYRGRPPPTQGYDGRRGYGDRPPPQMRRPARPPQSPDKMAFDNPFPSFPTKDPRGPRSIEGEMAAMNLNGGPVPPSQVPDRPHTSHGRRPPRPVSPGRGRNNYPAAPVRSASTGRPAASSVRSDRPYTDPNDPPPVPHVNRSATMPVQPTMSPPPPKPLYPGQSTYQDPYSHPQPGPHEHFDTEAWVDSYYNSAHAGESDMPNFDAMPDPAKGGVIDESLPGLEQPRAKAPIESPPSSRGGYTAFNPHAAGDPYPQSPVEARGAAVPNQFANAGFQFDLPNEGPPIQPVYTQASAGYGYNPHPYEEPHPQDQGNWGAGMPAYPESNSGYPVPEPSVRNNGPPRPYRPNQQTPVTEPAPAVSQPEALDPQKNPDALPHHPVPFRPGHDQASKPAPVRQYNNVNASAPPPAASPPQAAPVEPAASGPVTQQELQSLQQMAKSRPSDNKTQLLLAKKLVEASTVLVESSRMDPKTKAKARERYVMDGYKIVKKLASSGYADAQFFLADCYGSGQMGLQVDPKEAYSLYHSAAKSGHAQSAYRVAVCCEIGQEEGGGTKRDPFKAVQWYKRAASLGDPPAMYKMGMILLKGLLGQAKNPREGISWLKRAADRADAENPHALHELALMYANAGPNDVVVRDEAYASQLFHQAAELGYKFSQFRLGSAYEYGLMGCPVDFRQSIIWYTHAAAQGEHQSELALSGWYLTGAEGILQQSDTEAYLWARKAATAGLAKAEYAMGYFTEVGIGVAANLDDAKRWYWRAAAQQFPKARERLEEIKQGGARMQKTRLSRSAVNQQKQNEGDCVIM
ncbi:hypothetical protein AnigIFM59636_008034 [Aspergillus niger]|uniref:Contig An12c0230, genomic contig n=4 Tax=Aspergillus TaxID=5052 RepID=A2R064_ASPNC|nr:uncharacterized protein An12g07540 [Aspergillus niger]XP_025450816.1 uncharacterized protein BO96DRAFT_415195 [Aspergillus niger CBS 101883]RDH21786.1 hypothetical protein M747DRAFT_304067 [Aspergillus niger ATCC 13496]PYH52761.1 hypothetical protein BO96DRAFT_415195 [Aspergillus niger CBS 101883]TPR06276.1 N terminus of Rad21 / Rec8 like family protein [Aspergillus niger]CAK46378.1 unnamed protein product [Aspergillus niger]SPB45910.1 unnamed protein product [Aspergillus niger]|eukprot:XP_001395803.1 chitin synthase activator (Chs3) [Aspergillus niger CBS 513.88]